MSYLKNIIQRSVRFQSSIYPCPTLAFSASMESMSGMNNTGQDMAHNDYAATTPSTITEPAGIKNNSDIMSQRLMNENIRPSSIKSTSQENITENKSDIKTITQLNNASSTDFPKNEHSKENRAFDISNAKQIHTSENAVTDKPKGNVEENSQIMVRVAPELEASVADMTPIFSGINTAATSQNINQRDEISSVDQKLSAPLLAVENSVKKIRNISNTVNNEYHQLHNINRNILPRATTTKTVNVNIGRIEVKAASETPKQTKAAIVKQMPSMTLGEYLSKRNNEQR